MDTIFALSSGAPPAGVAVIRFSGPDARFAFETMAGGLPEQRRMVLRRLVDPVSGEPIDLGLVAWFPGPGSFSGEDSGEFHVHGGLAVVAAILDGLACLRGFRPAEAGEFSRRAYSNGKLDLTEIEGLADLISAETEAQRRLALGQSEGALRRRLEDWRARIIALRAHAEAAFDFADEADVPPNVDRDAASKAAVIAGEIEAMLANSHRGEIIRRGFQVVIMGKPNAGKSSLMNALAQRDVAIVSPEPGTTRDLLEVALDLGGIKVVLVDSAGLRETTGPVEEEGIRRAVERAGMADLVLWLSPVNDATAEPMLQVPVEIMVVRSKDDSGAFRTGSVSVVRPGGLDWIVDELTQRAVAAVPLDNAALISRSRHRTGLSACAAFLREASGETARPAEIRAELLRMASDEIGRLTGKIGVEDLLDRIFSEFCIGK